MSRIERFNEATEKRLAAKIADYWSRRGFPIAINVVEMRFLNVNADTGRAMLGKVQEEDGQKVTGFRIVSDLYNGMPRAMYDRTKAGLADLAARPKRRRRKPAEGGLHHEAA